jgi:pimeloyl-ACP methyl ester carboxylesterase
VIDPSRLGYVGFSWGASVGAIFSAVERRVHSFVLMSLVPRLSTDLREFAEERGATGDLDAYAQAIEPLDAVNYLPHAAPNALFFQFGRDDSRPSPRDGREAFTAASAPKKAQWYDGGHELSIEARPEREDSLAERLGVN